MPNSGFHLTDVSLSYGENPVVSSLNLSLRPGCTALVGPNGSGKSTVLSSLVRLLAPQCGAIHLDGHRLAGMSAKSLAKDVALLSQGAVNPDGIDVRTLVAYGRFPHRSAFKAMTVEDERIIDWALTHCGIAQLAHTPVTALSGGQAQRVWLARALAQDTPWLLADEPTTYLDLGHQTSVLRLLRRLHKDRGVSVVMVLHDLNQAIQYADWIVVLADGQVVIEGEPRDIITGDLLRDIYGIDSTILPHPENGLPLVIPAV